MFIIIAGGGKVGLTLAQDLLAEGHEVALIEKDRAKAARLEDYLGDSFIEGDATSVPFLQQCGAGRADAVVAVTGQDEDNLIICQIARKLGCRRTVARVNDPRNEETFHLLGIDKTVSSSRIIRSLIEEEVDVAGLITHSALMKGRMAIIEISLDAASPAIGKAVKDLDLPEACTLFSVIRGGDAIAPRGDTVLQEHDTVLAMVNQDSVAALRRVLAPAKA